MVFQTIVPRGFAVRPVPRRSRSHPLFSRELDGLWRNARAVAARDEVLAPRVDIQDGKGALRLMAELPGLESTEFEVVVEGEVVTIRSVKTSDESKEVDDHAVNARSRGEFSRSFRIPFEFDAESMLGSYRNGLLTVTIPKPAEPELQARTIPVTTD